MVGLPPSAMDVAAVSATMHFIPMVNTYHVVYERPIALAAICN
jgi:hypothetical protein